MFGNLINKAMSSANKLSSLASSYIHKDVQIYDASTNNIVVAGMDMVGWETATLTETDITKEVVGVSQTDVAVIKQASGKELKITFLPTSPSVLHLRKLHSACRAFNKNFIINITNNGVWHGDYMAQVKTTADVNMQHEADSVTFTFILFRIMDEETSNISAIFE